MRSIWPTLHAKLMLSIRLFDAEVGFDALRRSHPELRHYVDPAALLDHLHRPREADDGKDRALAALLTIAQSDGPGRELATNLAWLALWPGLDAVYRRLWRHYRNAPDDLASEISERLTVAIHRFDVRRVRRVAATVLMNVERDVRAAIRGETTDHARRCDVCDDGARSPPVGYGASAFGLPDGLDADAAAAMCRAALVPMIGDDADLVVAVAIIGETNAAVAARLGLQRPAARKRVQRAYRRLRRALEKN